MEEAAAMELTTARKPVARPRRIDIVPARPRPITSVAMVVVGGENCVFRYSACSDEQGWRGTVGAESMETAILDVISRVRETSASERIRFLVQLPPRSTLWALRDEIAVVMPGVCVERPRLSDERLMSAACARLRADRPATPQETGPVCVATAGSVRGKVTGYGWLASSGEYGLMGFRHSKKQIGPKVVLVAELRAIGKAAQTFRGREITMLSDSKLAIAMVKRWMAGEFVLPEGYTVYRENDKTPGLVTAQRMIYADRDNINPLWVKGHQGDFLNEGADALARLASRFVLGGSGLDNAEYHRRAQGLAESFSAAYNSQRSA
jgi:ribonuclease HI